MPCTMTTASLLADVRRDDVGQLDLARVADGAAAEEAIEGQDALRAGVALGRQGGDRRPVERHAVDGADRQVPVVALRRRCRRAHAARPGVDVHRVLAVDQSVRVDRHRQRRAVEAHRDVAGAGHVIQRNRRERAGELVAGGLGRGRLVDRARRGRVLVLAAGGEQQDRRHGERAERDERDHGDAAPAGSGARGRCGGRRRGGRRRRRRG